VTVRSGERIFPTEFHATLQLVGFLTLNVRLSKTAWAAKFLGPLRFSPAFDSAVICPVQPASFRSLFLIDLLCFSHAADSPAKADADVQGHSLPSW